MSSKPWYPMYPTDIQAKTRHLSMMERGAYQLMLDHYYATRKPLPADVDRIMRLCVAKTADERAAVKFVLEEFFTLQADGWHNKRADKELAKQAVLHERGKAGADARWGAKPDASDVPDGSETGGIPQPHTTTTTTTTATSKTTTTGKAGARKRASHKTPIPEGFQVSERVRQWAASRGFTHLEQHCEAFISKCKANDYRRADWDEAFMTAIRDDWARLRNGRGSVADANQRAAEAWLRGDA